MFSALRLSDVQSIYKSDGSFFRTLTGVYPYTIAWIVFSDVGRGCIHMQSDESRFRMFAGGMSITRRMHFHRPFFKLDKIITLLIEYLLKLLSIMPKGQRPLIQIIFFGLSLKTYTLSILVSETSPP